MPMGPLNDLLVYATISSRGPIGMVLAYTASLMPVFHLPSGETSLQRKWYC
jgi:hypothetical protein